MAVPNLDGMDREDVLSFWTSLQGRPVIAARKLFPDRAKGYTTAARNLGHYASNKAAAMLCRQQGRIADAQMYEAICERIYNKLPAFARW